MSKGTDYKTGRVIVDGRTFQIEFYIADLGMPWVEIHEIVGEETKICWFTKKHKVREITRRVDSGWMVGNRLEWAMNRIKRYILEESDKAEEARQIEAFCHRE